MIHGSLHERERERDIYTYVKQLNISIFLVGHLRLAMRTGGQVWRKHGKKKTWQESFMARNVRTP